MTTDEYLDFNITMLFPKLSSSKQLYIPTFLTSLPYFSQYVGAVSPRVVFGNVALEGLQSNITIDVSGS